MPVDDRTRLNLHRKLEAVLGREEADNLMAHLPPVTWNEVATKDDLTTLGTTLRVEMQNMGTELRSEMQTIRTELRSEMQAMGTELRSEMQTMRTELRSEMQTIRTELRSEMHVGFATLRADFVEGTNRQIKWMVTFAAAWSSLLVAVVRLIP
jgi:hypothetical protein